MKALLVDDNLATLALLTELVEREGHEVITATNGVDAVELFEQMHPDFLILDVMMPLMDGCQAARLIKSKTAGRYVPIIFLTALDDPDSLIRCLESGGDDFLSKPINMPILKSKLAAHTRIQLMSDELAEKNLVLNKYRTEIEREHRVAKGVFEKARERSCLNIPGVHYMTRPLNDFSGDLILGTPSARGGHFILLADFTGHGLPAAVGSLPITQVFFETASSTNDPGALAKAINRRLKQYLPSDMFAAAIILEICPASDSITFWMGGLPELFIVHGNDIIGTEHSTHVPLGILNDEVFDESTKMISLTPGTRILAYSDGIIEAINSEGEQYSQEGLQHAITSNSRGSSLIDSVVADCRSFRRGYPYLDDVSLLEISHDKH